MTSNGPPTPKGVRGPTPPLVSMVSEEEWEMEIPTTGSPSGGWGVGSMTPPTQGGEMVPAPDDTHRFFSHQILWGAGGAHSEGRRTMSPPLLNKRRQIIP